MGLLAQKLHKSVYVTLSQVRTACHTLSAHVLGSLYVIHFLQSLGFFFGKLLFVVIFTGSRYPVQEDAALLCISEVVNNGDEDKAEAGRAQNREYANHDAFCRRAESIIIRRYPHGIVICCLLGLGDYELSGRRGGIGEVRGDEGCGRLPPMERFLWQHGRDSTMSTLVLGRSKEDATPQRSCRNEVEPGVDPAGAGQRRVRSGDRMAIRLATRGRLVVVADGAIVFVEGDGSRWEECRRVEGFGLGVEGCVSVTVGHVSRLAQRGWP